MDNRLKDEDVCVQMNGNSWAEAQIGNTGSTHYKQSKTTIRCVCQSTPVNQLACVSVFIYLSVK